MMKLQNLQPYLINNTDLKLPLVTIIIPYKDDRGYIDEAIESVMNQTYGNLELILCQSDNFASVNFNKAFSISSGIYVKYLCDDDILPIDSIKKSIECILSDDYDFIHGNCENFSKEESTIYVPEIKIPTVDNLLKKYVIHGGTLLYHRRVFEKYGLFDETLWTAEEFELNLRILNNGAKIGYCNEILYKYRLHEKQKSIGNLSIDYQSKRTEIKNKIKNKFMFNSSIYWEQRYKNNGNSGSGSYGILANYKALVINEFIKFNNIKSIIDFGCGDGNQVGLLDCENYIGYDVSETIINVCKEKYKNDKNKSFFLVNEYQGEKRDLVLSLDVIFHLIEDEVFTNYMKTLFNASNKFVIIYSSNGEYSHLKVSVHIKDRNITDWIKDNISNFKLKQQINNPYRFDENIKDSTNTSMSNFYIYEKII